MTKLVCPQCQHENESARIYCHDCGARLDRSALAKEKPTSEDPQAAQRRLKSMFDPHRAKIRHYFFQFSKVLLGSCAAAAVIQMITPPEVPPRPKAVGLSSAIGLDLESAAMAHKATELRYSEAQVNAYVSSKLTSKQAALSNLLHFERALVHFDDGRCRVTVERSLYGYSLHSATESAVTLTDGKFVVSNRGGAIGRMPFHPQLMQFAGFLFSDLWEAFDRERKSLAKMSAITLQPQTVVITAK